jgi:hypothetical protein
MSESARRYQLHGTAQIVSKEAYDQEGVRVLQMRGSVVQDVTFVLPPRPSDDPQSIEERARDYARSALESLVDPDYRVVSVSVNLVELLHAGHVLDVEPRQILELGMEDLQKLLEKSSDTASSDGRSKESGGGLCCSECESSPCVCDDGAQADQRGEGVPSLSVRNEDKPVNDQ